MTPPPWSIPLALGACRAGRLLSLAGLAAGLFGLYMLTSSAGPTPSTITRLLGSAVVLATLPALYLGARLEIDHGLFQRLAASADRDTLAALDRALVELGLANPDASPRALAERARGTFRLAMRQGTLVAAQWLTALVAAWSG